MALAKWVGRATAPDVDRDFCVVAVCEDGQVRSCARVSSTPEGLMTLAASPMASDRVALEVTGSCWELARILEPHVDGVLVVSPDDTAITQARAKTDRLDARTVARAGRCAKQQDCCLSRERSAGVQNRRLPLAVLDGRP